MRDKEKARAYMREYNARNREKNLAYEKARYQENPEKFRAKAKAYRKANPEKVKAQRAAWRERNREKLRHRPRNPARMREARIRRQYRLTTELLARLLDAQGNACAICRRSFDMLEAHVDHRPGGDVRGILCLNCNSGIGQLRDDPSLLAAAIQYLLEPPASKLLTPQLRLFEPDIYAKIPEATRARATATMNRYLEAG